MLNASAYVTQGVVNTLNWNILYNLINLVSVASPETEPARPETVAGPSSLGADVPVSGISR